MSASYKPLVPARRPGGKPAQQPEWRVLVHHKFAAHYQELATRVGIQSAQRLWDYLATTPNQQPLIGTSTRLRGAAGRPKGPGWSPTYHYEASSMCRVDFQYHDSYIGEQNDPHKVVAILTINYSSH